MLGAMICWEQWFADSGGFLGMKFSWQQWFAGCQGAAVPVWDSPKGWDHPAVGWGPTAPWGAAVSPLPPLLVLASAPACQQPAVTPCWASLDTNPPDSSSCAHSNAQFPHFPNWGRWSSPWGLSQCPSLCLALARPRTGLG